MINLSLLRKNKKKANNNDTFLIKSKKNYCNFLNNYDTTNELQINAEVKTFKLHKYNASKILEYQ